MGEKQVTLNIDSDVDTRKGVFSDIAFVSCGSGMARIDFISGDRPGDDAVGAVLSSRVYMPTVALKSLRDAIEEQLARTAEGGDDVEHV